MMTYLHLKHLFDHCRRGVLLWELVLLVSDLELHRMQLESGYGEERRLLLHNVQLE